MGDRRGLPVGGLWTRPPANYVRTGLEDRIVIERRDIEAGEVVKFTSIECSGRWPYCFRHFATRALVYVGSPDIWLLRAVVRGCPAVSERTPMDAFRPGAPPWVDWPTFGPLPGLEMEFEAKNEGAAPGHFVAILIGEAVENPT